MSVHASIFVNDRSYNVLIEPGEGKAVAKKIPNVFYGRFSCEQYRHRARLYVYYRCLSLLRTAFVKPQGYISSWNGLCTPSVSRNILFDHSTDDLYRKR